MSDLVQQLRAASRLFHPIQHDAADALEAKDKEIAELEAKFMQTHNWLCDRNEQIATMRYENAIRFGTSHPEMHKTELDEAKDRIERLTVEYQESCRLVAQMHLAAVGGVVGPKLGVVKDVKAMKESHDKYKALCDQMAKEMEAAIPSLEIHFDAYFEALAKYKEMK